MSMLLGGRTETRDDGHGRRFRAACADCSYRSRFVGTLPAAEELLRKHKPRCRMFHPRFEEARTNRTPPELRKKRSS